MSETQTMEVEFALVPEDLGAIHAFHRKSGGKAGGSGNWLWVVILLAILGAFVENSSASGMLSFSRGVLLAFLAGLVLGVLLLGGFLLWARFFTLWSPSRFAKDPRNRWLF